MRLFIAPKFSALDKGEGGVRRVVEAQRKYLPDLGFEIVDDVSQAEIIAVHAGERLPKTGPKGVNPDALRVFHCHGLYWADYSWPKAISSFNKSLIDNAMRSDLVTTPCEWVADIFRKEMWLDPEVIYNGVELPDRLEATRGYVLWNKARVNSVCDPGPMADLARIASGVPFVSTFLPEGVALPNVKTTGALDYSTALDLVAKAGVYLSTTREVFSVGVLEALSYGVPVLGYNYGGNSEAVEHKVSGYLATPGDVDDLARGLEYCITHRARLSGGARVRAGMFSWESSMQDLAIVYEQALKKKAHGSMYKVSVIIPCHNLERFLPDSVGSVILAAGKMPLNSVEIIVVDDCSTGSVPAAIHPFMTQSAVDIMMVRTPRNLYLAEALNYGFERAHGQYLMALDADNRITPGALAVLSEALDKNDSLDCVYGTLQLIREDGSKGPAFEPKWPPAEFDIRAQLSRINQVSSTCLLRRELWERTRGYRQHELLGDDADLWTRAAQLGFKFARVTPEPTLQYRSRDDSMTAVSGDRARSYDWTAWAPKHRPFLGVSGSPEIHEPKISVVVKISPGEELQARDAIESLWPQTFDDWEVIVTSIEVLSFTLTESYPPYVKWDAEPKGELVLELSSHEWLENNALELLWDAYQQESGDRFVYSGWKTYDVGTRGPWHVILDKNWLGDRVPLDGMIVGALLKPCKATSLEGFTAIYLDSAILNRRNIGEKGERVMACSTCGASKARARAAAPAQPLGMSRSGGGGPVVEEGTVLVEFLGHGSRTVPMSGAVTYRFGEDSEHRTRRVKKAHLDRFKNSKDYRILENAPAVTPVLVDLYPDPASVVEASKEPVVGSVSRLGMLASKR